MASAVLEQPVLSANGRSRPAVRADSLSDITAPLRESGGKHVPDNSHHQPVDPNSTSEASPEARRSLEHSRQYLLDEPREPLSDLDFKHGPEWSSNPSLEQLLAAEMASWAPFADTCSSEQKYSSSDYALSSKADRKRLSKMPMSSPQLPASAQVLGFESGIDMQSSPASIGTHSGSGYTPSPGSDLTRPSTMSMSDPQMPASTPTSSGNKSRSAISSISLSDDPKSYYAPTSDFYDHVHLSQCRGADVKYIERYPCQGIGLTGPERQGFPPEWARGPGRSPRLGFFNNKADKREHIYQSSGEAAGPID